MWTKREKTEEKRKIEFQNRRRKTKKQNPPIPFDPGPRRWELGLLQSCEILKKKRRKREEKRKEKEEREGKERGKTEIPASQDCWDRRSKAHVEGTTNEIANPIPRPASHES